MSLQVSNKLDRSCPDCREYSTYVVTNHPHSKLIVYSYAWASLWLVVFGLNATIWGIQTDRAVAGVSGLMTVATLIAWVVLYRTTYRRHNVVGYQVWAGLDYGGQLHIHLHENDFNRLVPLLALVQIPIAGGTRHCQIHKGGKNSLPLHMTCTDGKTLTLSSDVLTRLTTYDVRIALLFISEEKDFDCIARHKLTFDRRVLVELKVLQALTGRNDPLGHGLSKHGQVLNERLTVLLRSLDYDPASTDQAEREIAEIHQKGSAKHPAF